METSAEQDQEHVAAVRVELARFFVAQMTAHAEAIAADRVRAVVEVMREASAGTRSAGAGVAVTP